MREGRTFLKATHATWSGLFVHILLYLWSWLPWRPHIPSMLTYWHSFGGLLEENMGTALVFYDLFTHVEVGVARTLAIFFFFGECLLTQWSVPLRQYFIHL